MMSCAVAQVHEAGSEGDRHGRVHLDRCHRWSAFKIKGQSLRSQPFNFLLLSPLSDLDRSSSINQQPINQHSRLGIHSTITSKQAIRQTNKQTNKQETPSHNQHKTQYKATPIITAKPSRGDCRLRSSIRHHPTSPRLSLFIGQCCARPDLVLHRTPPTHKATNFKLHERVC